MTDMRSNWVTASLGDVCQFVRGIAFPSADKHIEPAAGLIACLRTKNVQKEVDWSDLWFIPASHVKNEHQKVVPGDILISSANSYDLVGKVALVRMLEHPSTFGAFIGVIRRAEGVDPSFLYYRLSAPDYQNLIRGTASQTTNISNISTSRMLELPFSLPPLNEQRRIVAKLDALFEKSRSIREKLDRLPRLLANLQKSILNSAFRGDLTKEWRAKNPNAEPASELLKRIRAERRAKWEADLIAKGKDPKKAKYVEPEPVDTEGLPELPEGWCWASVEEIAFNFDGKRIPVKSDDRKKMAGPYPYYGASGVIDSVDQYIFDGNYLLIAEDGANLLSRSTPIAFTASGKFWVNNHAHVVQTAGGIPLEYLAAYLESIDLTPFVRGMAQPKLNQQQLNSIAVPLPPLTEMKQLVKQISSLSDRVSFLADQTEKLSPKVTTFEASSLQKAFRGELVPQDPNDEPASVLLERIRAQKPAAGTKRGRGRKAAA